MRGLLAIGVALLVNLLLVWLMQQMVQERQPARPLARPDPMPVGFVRVKPPPEPPPQAQEPPETPEEPPPPPLPETPRLSLSRPQAPLASPRLPRIDLPLRLGKGPSLGSYQAPPAPLPKEAVPLVRVAPQYPQRALRRRKQGSVKIAFTIEPDGRVSDPKVIQADPPGYFEEAALRAIRRWKFQPKREGGVAVARQAIQTIHFTLGK